MVTYASVRVAVGREGGPPHVLIMGCKATVIPPVPFVPGAP